jgi:hypothetical protein
LSGLWEITPQNVKGDQEDPVNEGPTLTLHKQANSLSEEEEEEEEEKEAPEVWSLSSGTPVYTCTHKCKVAPVLRHRVTQIYGGDEIVPRIRNVGKRWRQVVSHALWPLYPRQKDPPHGAGYTLDPVWMVGKKKKKKKKKIPFASGDWTAVVQPIVSHFTESYRIERLHVHASEYCRSTRTSSCKIPCHGSRACLLIQETTFSSLLHPEAGYSLRSKH